MLNRSPLATVLAGTVAVGSVATVAPSTTHAAGLRGFDVPEGSDQARARRLFRLGNDAYRAGDYATAIVRLEEAHALDPDPAFLYDLALAHWRGYSVDGDMAHLHRARELLGRYLERVDRAESRRRNIPAQLEAIDHDIERARTQPAAPPTPVTAAPAFAPPRSIATERPRLEKMGYAGYALLGAGVIGAVTGSLVGFVTAGKLDGERRQAQARGSVDAEAQRRLDERIEQANRLAYIALGVGGAVLLTGVVLVILDGKRRKHHDSRRARVEPRPGGFSMSF